MRPTNSGRWPSTVSFIFTSCSLLLIFIVLTSCSQAQSPRPTSSPPAQSTATPVVTATPAISRPSIQLNQNHTVPTWTELKLLPGCSFHAMSPNWQWLLLRGCPSTQGDTADLIVHVSEHGDLGESLSLSDKFTLLGEKSEVIGFTSDGSELVLKQDNTFWLVSLPDLTRRPYVASTFGTSGINYLGSERWSPEGNEYLGFGCLGCNQITIFSPEKAAAENAIDVGRHGAQSNWCATSQEIVYTEGDYEGTMRARILNLKSGQPRTLIDSQFPVNVTGVSCSLDKRWLAVREQEMDTTHSGLWLVDQTSNSKVHLEYDLSGGADVFDGWQDLIWSPDSSRLALRGSSTGAKHGNGFIVVEIPTGRIIFTGTEEGISAPLSWNLDSQSILALDYHFRTDSYSLRWIPIGR